MTAFHTLRGELKKLAMKTKQQRLRKRRIGVDNDGLLSEFAIKTFEAAFRKRHGMSPGSFRRQG